MPALPDPKAEARVLIVAKTRQAAGACVGGILFDGRSVRLIDAWRAAHDGAGLEYEVGDVWEIEGGPAAEIVPPHVENFVVRRKRRLIPLLRPEEFIERHMPPRCGGIEALFEGLARVSPSGALRITREGGIPSFSTMFWRPDRPLERISRPGKRVRYRYAGPDGEGTLVFVGFQEPPPEIPAGTLLRVSLSHWWRPEDQPEVPPCCYVQLSGWFADAEIAATEPAPPAAAPQPPCPGRPETVLKSVFGFDRFRPFQKEVVERVLSGRDTLAVMPTGSGKSLCYQLPALLLDGLTVVVSPLIALMQDQVDHLRESGVRAVYLNSSLSHREYGTAAEEARSGRARLLFVSPETLLRPETLLLLDSCGVALLVIDEAHCISEWGHDFRPEYRKLSPVRRRYGTAACLALTATATERVRRDIQRTLGLPADAVVTAGFDRPNLFLSAERRQAGFDQTLRFLAARSGQPGIVYCSTRERVEALSGELDRRGFRARPYHAGMEPEARRRCQREFSADDIQIVVATIAFGMGIDKSNVRWVLHANLPDSLERYYQEIGRAGRDGLRADCLLLFGRDDAFTIRHFIDQGAAEERPGRSARLGEMLRYAEHRGCRRARILPYFGDPAPEAACGMCDNCLAPARAEELEDASAEARLFLRGVLETRERFGPAHVVDVLRGSASRRILERGHDRLVTYGAGGALSARQWRRLADHLLDAGAVVQDQEHGQLRLTGKGRAILAGEAFQAPREPAAEPEEASSLPAGCDRELFEILRRLRKRLADEAGVPPFVLFSDRSLTEMATSYPRSPEAFLATHGVGERKLREYGDAFTGAIREYCEQHGIDERAPAPQRKPPPPGAARRRDEVGELFAAGLSIGELAARLQVRPATIVAHLRDYLRDGGKVDAARVLAATTLSEADRNRVLRLFAEEGTERLGPIYAALAGAIPYEELHLLRVYFEASHRQR